MTLRHLDRRIIFAVIFSAVALPLLFPLGLTGGASQSTRTFYDTIDALSAGDAILISFDCEASSWPEVGPVARAIVEHAQRKSLRIIGTSFLSEGTSLGYELLASSAVKHRRTYGSDWVYLGFRPQYVAAMLGMGESITREFQEDFTGQVTATMPIFAAVDSYRGIKLVISIADDSMPQYWIEYAGARYGVQVTTGLSAVMVTTFTPYLDSGQLSGLIGGLKGAAEYEKMLGIRGAGIRGMDTQSSAHLAIILLVVFGNVIWFTQRRTRE